MLSACGLGTSEASNLTLPSDLSRCAQIGEDRENRGDLSELDIAGILASVPDVWFGGPTK
jgi:hypothetical protein